ncbi:uncharacterized protein LOC123321741 [Coccinella septempunctata]|uniref:uncharacterized protein LOC123321741 n=1 Tax=Coccinella septempunctata TaxID=41139 RepID=UPI001D0852C6|nr:uncharacterized protein LOC123321741 [Coccinella septempunctata]
MLHKCVINHKKDSTFFTEPLKSTQKNLKISFKTQNTLQQLLVYNKDPIPILEKAGVYKLKCGEPSCNIVYIGRSGRNIATRIKEHLMSQRIMSNNKSIFGKHLKDTNHEFDPNTDVELLHPVDYGFKQETWEELEIYKHSQSRYEEPVKIMSTNTVPPLFKILKNC